MFPYWGISHRKAAAAILLALPAPAIILALNSREPAPKFRAKTTTGELITNDTAHGKVILVQFWTTWCPYCKSDASVIEKLNTEFESQGLLVLGVNVAESKKKVKQFLEQSPRSSRVVLMDDTNLAAVFEAKRFPLYVLIDRNGNIAGTQEGAGGEGALRHLLRKAGIDSRAETDENFDLRSSPRQQ